MGGTSLLSFVCGFAQQETFFSVPEESLPNLRKAMRILANDTPHIKKYAHTFIFFSPLLF